MEAETLEAARQVASRFLEYSPRSRAEVERRLERAGFPADVRAAVVEECAAAGWIDDEALSTAWVADRADRKSYGRLRIASELKRKGVARETVDAAVEAMQGEQELARAMAAVAGRWSLADFQGLRGAARQAARRRCAGFLQRRGFAWEIVEQVLGALDSNSH